MTMSDLEKNSHITREVAVDAEASGAYELGAYTTNDDKVARINTYEREGDLAQYQTNVSSAASELSPEHREYLMAVCRFKI